MARFEFGFQYSGPRDAVPDMNCATCRAKETQDCPTHGRGYAMGCSHCGSAQGAPCQAHWGLQAAIDFYGEHVAKTDPDALPDFKLCAQMLMAEAPSKKKNVTVYLRSDGSLADTDHRELHLEITARV